MGLSFIYLVRLVKNLRLQMCLACFLFIIFFVSLSLTHSCAFRCSLIWRRENVLFYLALIYCFRVQSSLRFLIQFSRENKCIETTSTSIIIRLCLSHSTQRANAPIRIANDIVLCFYDFQKEEDEKKHTQNCLKIYHESQTV